MYASMPYLLEETIMAIYSDCGWNLTNTTNRHSDSPWATKQQSLLFPTLEDLRDKIDVVVAAKGYDIRLQMDLSAALRTRIGSLLLGGKGAMLNTPCGLDMGELRKRNVVLELASIGNDDDKCLIMALLLLALHEEALLSSSGSNDGLRHVIVVEEAHRIFRKAAPADNPEIANIRGAAVEQFANTLAEMRALGQGVIVIDQIPSKLVSDVIKNTALKCVHQLGAEDDRRAVGETMTLDASQQMELARLQPSNGEAVVYHQSWEKAYLIKVPWHGSAQVCPADLAKVRETVIEANPQVFGEHGQWVGHTPSDDAPDIHTEVAKVLLGLSLPEKRLLSVLAIVIGKQTGTGLDIALGTWQEIGTLSPAYYVGMLSVLRDVLRTGSARADLLAECSERFAELMADITTGRDAAERIMALNGMLRDAVSSGDPARVIQGAAARYYARAFDLGRIPIRVGQTKVAGDAAYEAMSQEMRQHANRLVPDPNMEEIRRDVERLLVEQAVMLAGFQNVREIVERYHNFT
jgi:hypothetical protein